MHNFSEALPHILKFEGGYVNDPDDPGGATNKGITQAVYDSWRISKNLQKQPVRLITDSEVSVLYKQNYWDAIKGDNLPTHTSLVIFDAAVNQGLGYAAKLLQYAVKVPQDGTIGPGTLAAVNSKSDIQLAQDILWARVFRYVAICRAWRMKGKANPYKYIDGWLSRLDSLRGVITTA